MSQAYQIQSDLDALPLTGGEVRLPPGEFRLAEPLRDAGQDDVTISGCGRSTRLIVEAPDQSAFCIGPRKGWLVRDLSIRGTGFGGDLTLPLAEGCGVVFDGAEDCRVTGVKVENFRKGVYLRGSCRHCSVDHNLFSDLNNAVNEDAWGSQPGVYPVGNQAHNNTSLRVRAHYITDNRNPNGLVGGVGMLISNNVLIGHNVNASTIEYYGIRLYDAIGSVVTGNILRDLEGGIELMREARDCVVANNTIGSFVPGVYSGHGVWIRQEPMAPAFVPSGNIIAGNVIAGAWGHGILAEAGRDNDLDSNSISNCGRNGIRVAAPYCGVRGNRIKYVGEHGIYVTGAPSGSTQIIGNFLKGNPAHAGEMQQWDAIYVDATAGGPVVVVGNELWNDQLAGWRFGINHASGGMLVEHAHNKFFRLAGTVNPANLPALP